MLPSASGSSALRSAIGSPRPHASGLVSVSRLVSVACLALPACLALVATSAPLCAAPAPTKAALAQSSDPVATDLAANNVTWTSLGSGQNDSMPIGNGDLAANLWIEPNGDLVLLLAKADAWTETGKLVKPGRIRIHFAPALFTGSGFQQTLRLDNGSVELTEGSSSARVWIDALHPALHVEAHSAQPVALTASLETWRTTHPIAAPSPDRASMYELGSDQMPVSFAADRILPTRGGVRWFHWNQQSIYPTVLTQEHLGQPIGKYPDPLLHRCFGGLLTGAGMHNLDSQTIASDAPATQARIDLVAASGRCETPDGFAPLLAQTLNAEVNPASLDAAWAAHLAWWQQFWNRSWIRLSGTPDALRVSQSYAIQRYMMAAQSRGELPAKHNGGLFTVGGAPPAKHAGVEHGRLVLLQVTPASRCKDVTVLAPSGNECLRAAF